jgi:hypothetical protein
MSRIFRCIVFLALTCIFLTCGCGGSGRSADNYYSGNNSMNTITDANWKVYDCGIAQMTEQGLVNCVNSY